MKNDTSVVNPEVSEKPKTKLGWALHFAGLGMPIHRLVYTLPDGSCSCGSKPNEEGTLIIPGTDNKKCSPGKHPLPGVLWLYDRTTDAAKIKQWFKDDPAMNYGVSGGKGYTITDPDVKGGKDGIKALADLLGIKYSAVSRQTFTVRTPTGGLHQYWLDPVDRSNSPALPGVDCKSHNGYVVGPGSVIHMEDKEKFEVYVAESYEVVNDVPMADIPEAIVKLLGKPTERAENADQSLYPEEVNSERAEAAARKAFEKEIAAEQGKNGDDRTYAAICMARDWNISQDRCLEILTEKGGWNERCDPPWSYDELKVKIENAYRYAKNPMGSKYLPESNLMELFGLEDSAKENLENEIAEIRDATGSNDSQGKWTPYSETEIKFGELLKREKPPVDYIVDGLIEKFELCLFQGAGGAGKGRALAQLCACLSFDLPFIGHQIAKGQEWVFIGNEDDWKEMGRRFDRMLPGLESLARQNNLELEVHDSLRGRFIDRTGRRTSLARIAENETKILPGAVLFRRYLKSIPGHKLVILDSAYDFADWIGAAKVSETLVNWYCKVFLKFLEKDTDSTFILIAHPSQAGEDRKDESGWSVAWRNAIRSRIGFRKKRGRGVGREQGAIIPGSFTMAVHKLSHGPDGHEIPLYESEGIFVAGVREEEPSKAATLSEAFYLYAVEKARDSNPVLPGRNPDKAMCKAIAMVKLPGSTDDTPVTLGYTPLAADVKELIKSGAGGKLISISTGGRHKAGLYPKEVADQWARELKAKKPLTAFNPPAINPPAINEEDIYDTSDL